VALCESTLTFGKAEEAAPQLRPIDVSVLVDQVAEDDGITVDTPVTLRNQIATRLHLLADGEQLYRILSNLIRNSRQAIEATGKSGVITVTAGETPTEHWILLQDTGPGLPDRARAHLFEAFQGGARKGGTGLGLAIAAELVRGHGGRLELLRSSDAGTEFIIHLPKLLS
jgi:signal transduction histidine kinase